MLEQLFGSRTRIKLLRLLLANPQEAFFVRELTRKIDERINSVRRELSNLEEMGLLRPETKDQKKYYHVDTNFPLYEELRALVLKAHMTNNQQLANRLAKAGKISLLYLTGVFTGVNTAKTDVLIVGAVNKSRTEEIMRDFSKSIGREINYTAMTAQEFQYRKDITDRFLYNILENKHQVVVDDKTV